MIDPMVFARWLGVWTERLGGKPLSEPTSMAYYTSLSRELSTEQFDAAMQIVFAKHRFNTWPSPAEIVAAVRQTPDDAINAGKAWDLAVRIITGYATPGSPGSNRTGRETQLADTAGPVAYEAYTAAGGWHRVRFMTESNIEFVRKEFLEHFESIAQRNRHAVDLHAISPALARPLLPTPHGTSAGADAR